MRTTICYSIIAVTMVVGCKIDGMQPTQRNELKTTNDKVLYLLNKLEISSATEKPSPKKNYWIFPYEWSLYFSQARGLALHNKDQVIDSLRKHLHSDKESYRYWSAELLLFLQIDISEIKEEIRKVPDTLSKIPGDGLKKSIEINMLPNNSAEEQTVH